MYKKKNELNLTVQDKYLKTLKVFCKTMFNTILIIPQKGFVRIIFTKNKIRNKATITSDYVMVFLIIIRIFFSIHQ